MAQHTPDPIPTETGTFDGDGGYTSGTLSVITARLSCDQVAAITGTDGLFCANFRVPRTGLGGDPEAVGRELLAYLLDELALPAFGPWLSARILSGSYSYSVPGGRIAQAQGRLDGRLRELGYARQPNWA